MNMATEQAKKVRLAPGSDLAVAVREAKRSGTPVEFEDGDATYRFVPDTSAQAHDETMPAWQALVRQPTAQELVRRHEVVTKILANRARRVISPSTAADLVRAAREERVLDE